MTALIINNVTPFGSMSNAAVTKLIQAANDVHRIKGAMDNACYGLTGAPLGEALETGTNFGVTPSATPGEQGTQFHTAILALDTALQAFLTAQKDNITALDNGE